MNLAQVYQLIVAADQQPQGFLKITNSAAEYDVREMTHAGLVEATLNDGKEGGFTAINRVTEAGRTFLRTFEKDLRAHVLPPPE